MPAPARQTQSYLRGLFARHGISPRHHLGQNFLIDLNIHELIVDSAELAAGDVVLEVGTGAGALTALMGSRGATVVAVEVDPGMAALTREAVADMPAVRVIHSDALANKNTLSPALIEAVEEAMARGGAARPGDGGRAPASSGGTSPSPLVGEGRGEVAARAVDEGRARGAEEARPSEVPHPGGGGRPLSLALPHGGGRGQEPGSEGRGEGVGEPPTSQAPLCPLKLVANLPYSVATPVISNLLVSPRLSPFLLVVTIQRELADRMLAAPSTPGYGSLAILVQALADVELVRVLQPQVFWPRPKVESAVVRIRPSAERRASIDVPWFHDVVRKAFLHRRKNLRHVLAGMWPDRWTKPDVDAFLAPLSIEGSLRAEALTVPQFLALAAALKGRWSTAPAVGEEEWQGEDGEPSADEAPAGQ
ncbi:Ribosomal RNA small subunit methyltransferase A [Aquisphaera giovannonii]|uniref:Ribosomal RNA small subunit methyltransferase A n=1 Tax=Aquisphaera giovannonii TaxID=406548 RepID=A0A5B9WEJ2_9BACT|nr:rRNA adenine N-6-methyltransferase family protein [Aquisphaera giovannonii]QEH39002.1 Ribosomal RNA small subunit methyltransferase A [Aquisphaera giovannonii]